MFIDEHSDLPDIPSATHNLSSMSNEDFFKWLGSKGISDKDCKTLSGKYKVPLTTNSWILPPHAVFFLITYR